MSQNIFDKTNNVDNNIQRHSFDWSHSNFFTARLGYLYPCLTELVPANSKLEINTNLGMQFMPLAYPLQTRLKARVSFFKVPLRILWRDYMDYVGNFRTDLEEPYHDIPEEHFDKFFGECELADRLDIPNVVYTNNNSVSPTFSTTSESFSDLFNSFVLSNGRITTSLTGGQIQTNPGNISSFDYTTTGGLYSTNCIFQRILYYALPNIPEQVYLLNNLDYTLNLSEFPLQITIPKSNFNNLVSTIPLAKEYISDIEFTPVLISNSGLITQQFRVDKNNKPLYDTYVITETTDSFIVNFSNLSSDFVITPFDSNIEEGEPLTNINRIGFVFSFRYHNTFEQLPSIDTIRTVQNSLQLTSFDFASSNLNIIIEGQQSYGEATVITKALSPYYSSTSNPDGLRLKSYRARAYECIYNAYYRDPRNNPLFDEQGKPVYNKWLLNYDGGADTTKYQLRRANWEKDFLTTAVHSPQQGQAPLVGLTQYISNVPDESNLAYNIALVDESGTKYKIKFSTSGDTYGIPGNIEVSEILPDNTPVSSINFSQLVNATNYGISIPDLRLVNAYQKFLELNIRKGYSYKDIIEGRFDCKVRFDELLMPEFLGGFTRDITMNRVVQSIDANLLTSTSPNYKGSQGALSGDAFLSATDNPKISVFCDEESIIMGIMSIVPTPAYNQLLPKDFLYSDLLDHFNPEFNHLGFQPIKYAEICPLQCKAFNINPEDTFGYQRPWYEYVAKTDKVHGLMRTNLRDFIMNRNFNAPPILNESFLLVDDNQLNDVFQVTNDEDKIVGQFDFNIRAELPISRVAIPRLD